MWAVFAFIASLLGWLLSVLVCVISLTGSAFYIFTFLDISEISMNDLPRFKVWAFYNLVLIAVFNAGLLNLFLHVEPLLALLMSGAISITPAHTIGWGYNPLFMCGLSCLTALDAVTFHLLFGLSGFTALLCSLIIAVCVKNYCSALLMEAEYKFGAEKCGVEGG